MKTPRSEPVFRWLLYAGWALGLVSLLKVEDPPFSVGAAVAGVLLLAAGVVAATDGGRALAEFNRRHGSWLWPPHHRYLGSMLALIGACWLAFGVAATVS